jgi:hypothetical protein
VIRKSVIVAIALSAPLPCFGEIAHADEPAEAAPLPSKDIRWSVAVAAAADVGSLPRAAPGVALGFDVRRGALGFRVEASAFLPQVDRASDARVGLFDAMAMICALAPIGSFLDVGACGGLGAGMLRAESDVAYRPQGLGIVRADLVVFPGFLLTLDAGTVLDPLRTELSLPAGGAGGDAYRASLLSFRGTLGFVIRMW